MHRYKPTEAMSWNEVTGIPPSYLFTPQIVPVSSGQSGTSSFTLIWYTGPTGGDGPPETTARRTSAGARGVKAQLSTVAPIWGTCLYRGTGSVPTSTTCAGNGSEYRLAFCTTSDAFAAHGCAQNPAACATNPDVLGATPIPHGGLIEGATYLNVESFGGDRCATTSATLTLTSPPDADGDGIPECLAGDTNQPSWPPGSTLAATANGQNSATLVWTAAIDDVGVTAYRVSRDGQQIAQVAATTLTATVSDLAPNVTYTFAIQAVDASGNVSTTGPTTTLRIDGAAPTWPAGSTLAASASGQASAALQWTAATDDVAVTGYRIFQDAQLVAEVAGSTLTTTITGLAAEVTYGFQVQAVDAAGNVSTSGPNTTLRLDGTPPSWPPDSALTATWSSAGNATLSWTAAIDAVGVAGYRLYQDGAVVRELGAAVLSAELTGLPPDAAIAFRVEAFDAQGNESVDGPRATLAPHDVTAPVWPSGSTLTVSAAGPRAITLRWTAATDDVAVSSYRVLEDGAVLATLSATTLEAARDDIDPQHTYAYRVVAVDRAGNAADGPSATFRLPPSGDPSDVAPPLPPAPSTNTYAQTSFLYTGPDPIQRDVAAGAITPARASQLRGRVIDGDGQPVSEVTVAIVGHAELGYTRTRADGWFDLVANGGQPLTVRYTHPAYITAYRTVDAAWDMSAAVPDVILVRPDGVSTELVGDDTAMQIAQGSRSVDGDGARQATLLVPAGTSASMTLLDGTTVPLSSFRVRMTEFTVGPEGAAAMPAALPPNSGYTYAVDLRVDEASALAARGVAFSTPLPLYVDNFVGFPVGTPAPAGYYDEQRSQWVASKSGRVIAVVDIVNGLATLDTDGDGAADTPEQLAALNISDAERVRLATLYPTGKSLWRVPIPHFSFWDVNWGFFPPADAVFPRTPPKKRPPKRKPCPDRGSIIGCEDQSLGEEIPLVGTRLGLVYTTKRSVGRVADRKLTIPLTDASPPASLRRVKLSISVAGQRHTQEYAAAPNLTHVFVWDGMSYGRLVTSTVTANVTISYVYGVTYQKTDTFGYNGGGRITGTRNSSEVELKSYASYALGGYLHVPANSLGGWSLGDHHALSVRDATVYLGNGQRQQLEQRIDVDPRSPSDPNYIETAVADRDGTLLTTRTSRLDGQNRTSQIMRSVADDNGSSAALAFYGNGAFGFRDGPAAQAMFADITAIAIAADGSIYVLDSGNLRIRRIAGGVVSTVAGTGVRGSTGDGGPATAAAIEPLAAVSGNGTLGVGPDGAVYFGERLLNGPGLIRRIGPDGIISIFAGRRDRTGTYSGDGGPATDAEVAPAGPIRVGPDGAVYFVNVAAGGAGHSIRRVGIDGTITRIAGKANGSTADDISALEAQLSVSDLAIAADGTLYVANVSRLRAIDASGIIATIAGSGASSCAAAGAPLAVGMRSASSLSFAPDGRLYFADTACQLLRRMSARVLQRNDGTHLVPSADGADVYRFDAGGRHLETIDATNGAKRLSFTYDADGKLATVVDSYGNAVTIDRSTPGEIRVVAPFGQTTRLLLDAAGYLEHVVDPSGELIDLEYSPTKLLTAFTHPLAGRSTFEYDADGLLLKDTSPGGGFKTLSRSGDTVTRTTRLGRTRAITVTANSAGKVTRTVVNDGVTTREVDDAAGLRTITYSDGSERKMHVIRDPRFGMDAPMIDENQFRTPAGRTTTTRWTQTVNLATPGDPLSVRTLSVVSTANGLRSWSQSWDSATRTLERKSPMGRRVTATIDAHGRITATNVPGLLPKSYIYNDRGQPFQLAQGDRTLTFHHDDAGRLSRLVYPTGAETVATYDAVGRVVASSGPDQRTVAMRYEEGGRKATLTVPSGAEHVDVVEPEGLRSTYQPPAVVPAIDATRRTELDFDGALARVLRGGQPILAVQRDAAGRPTTVTMPEGTYVNTYNAAGQLESQRSPNGIVNSYVYDGPLLTDRFYSGAFDAWVQLGFDSDLRAAAETVQGDKIAFFYDADGNITQAGQLVLGRDAANALVSSLTVGSVVTSLARNGYGEVDGLATTAAAQPLYSATVLARDLGGRIVERRETTQGVTHTYSYRYDVMGRLEAVAVDGEDEVTYEYDANGSRERELRGAEVIVAGHDAQDRLVTYGRWLYGYTSDGALESKVDSETDAMTTYQYTASGHLVGVGLPSGDTVGYTFDSEGHRVERRVNGALTHRWVYGIDVGPAAELDASGNVVTRFVYGTRPWVPAYLVRGGTTYAVVTDDNGSVRLVVDAATGVVAQRLDYDAFGRVQLDTNPGFQPFGFGGGLYDPATGLVRMLLRDYDAATGRWTSKDPRFFAGGDANLYAYVRNDPINHIDPSGTDIIDDIIRIDGEILDGMWYSIRNFWSGDMRDDYVVDAIAGFGDGVSNGRTKTVREVLGLNELINPCDDYARGLLLGKLYNKLLKLVAASEGGYDAESKERFKPRQSTLVEDWDGADEGSTEGTKKCPTCGGDMTIPPFQGPRDWDVDHHPDAWSDRNHEGMTRDEMRDDYQEGTRARCIRCNRADNKHGSRR